MQAGGFRVSGFRVWFDLGHEVGENDECDGDECRRERPGSAREVLRFGVQGLGPWSAFEVLMIGISDLGFVACLWGLGLLVEIYICDRFVCGTPGRLGLPLEKILCGV